MIIYFRDSEIKERHRSLYYGQTSKYRNIGRVNINGEWKDSPLSIPFYYYPDTNKPKDVPEYPIFRVIKITKAYIEMEGINSNSITRLIKKREYLAYILHEEEEDIGEVEEEIKEIENIGPKIEAKQSTLDQFFNLTSRGE